MMRRRGPSLVRAAATTAVVVGTANAVTGHQQQKAYDKQMAEQAQIDQAVAQQMAAQQQYAPPPQAAAPAQSSGGMTEDMVQQLTQLNQLLQAGILTQAEFDVQKAKILNS